jgi:hypothetical protein
VNNKNRKDELRNPRNVDPTDLLRRAKKVGADRDWIFASMLEFQGIDPSDSELTDMMTEKLDEAELENLVNPDPFRVTNPIAGGLLEGSIGLGIVPPAGVPWLITPEMLTNHILICGRSGGGKTNLILVLLIQLLERHSNDQGV